MCPTTDPSPPPPAATGVRASWYDLPPPVRGWVDETLGSEVVEARTQPGGFSPGVAVRVVCADGSRAFAKAVSSGVNPDSPDLYRNERRVVTALPAHPSLPRLLGGYDDGTWVVLLFADVEGRQPGLPWRRDELTRVLGSVAEARNLLDPSPVRDAADIAAKLSVMAGGWAELADRPPVDLDPWVRRNLDRLVDLAANDPPTGTALVHLDLRADNMLLTASGEVVLVDWANAGVGPGWLDLVHLMLEVEAYGGHDVDQIIADHPLTAAVDPWQVTQAVLAMAGMFESHCRRPAPPGLPTVREFQRAYARTTTGWLRRRLG